MKQSIALVTLAVDDVGRALTFYRDGLGWAPAFEADGIAFFQMNGFAFSLYRRADFEAETGRAAAPGASGIALAHNVASREDVDAVLDHVGTLPGAAVTGAPVERPWGGYSGYFSDPDGHHWEVAWNPHWTYSPEGHVTI